jgi:hypothetical protein
MKTVEFSTATMLPRPPEDVLTHLTDPNNHLGLSPLVVEVRDIRRTPDEVRFTAVERFTLGPFHHDNVIEVSPRLGDGTISGDVDSRSVKLGYDYLVTPAPNGAQVVDHYRLSAPFGLVRFAVSQAKKVQGARGHELVRRFEAKRTTQQ